MATRVRTSTYAEESAEVEVLFASLEKMKSLTKKIQGSMSRLEVSGRTVQDAIGPVYGNTQRLQTTNANADKILEAIDRFKEPLDMRNREERILRSRPDRVGLAEYVSSMDRTNQALRDLKSSNLRSNQQAVAELSSLLQGATQNMEDVFREMCRRDSQPIEPLGYIMKGSEFPRLSSNKSAQLRTINAQVYNFAGNTETSGLTQTAKVYANERGQYMTLSLQNLAAASLSTAKKIGGADAIYRKGSNGIGTYANGIEGMCLSEYDNICAIFGRGEWGPVLSATCQTALSGLASTLQHLEAHVRSNLLTDCYLAYEIIEVVSNMSFSIENRTGELKLPISEALRPIRETAKSSLSSLLSDTRAKVQQMSQFPSDASAVPVTSEVTQRLQLMTAYLPTITSILRSLGDGGWAVANSSSSSVSVSTLKSFDVGADGKQLFAHYGIDTIETLLSNLENKSRSLYKGKILQGAFLANNVAVIDRAIRSAELQLIASSAQPKIDAWKKKAAQIYVDAWKEVTTLLLDVWPSNRARPPSGSQGVDLKVLSSKDRDNLKEKFKTFNVTFDELVARHKSLRLEGEVRRQLGREVQHFIEPLYARFWERYHEVDKGKGKYVKYDKAQVSSVLGSLS